MAFVIGRLPSRPAAIFNLSSWALMNNVNARKLYNKLLKIYGSGVYGISRDKSNLMKKSSGKWESVLERENALLFLTGVPLDIVPVPDVKEAEIEEIPVEEVSEITEVTEISETPKNLICDICGYEAKSSTGLSIHIGKKHGD